MMFSDIVSDIVFEEDLIKEGGNAFPNVTPIKQQDIQQTIKNFIAEIIFPTLHLTDTSKEIFTLGSTGKKPESGDIDLALNVNFLKTSIKDTIKLLYTYTKLHTNIPVLLNSYEPEMIQFAYPVNFSKTQLVQIDLLLTKYPVFTKWYMHSPDLSQSKYKAAHRNDLLRAIPRTLTFNPVKILDNIPVTWTQEDINPRGTYKQIQTIVDQNNNRLTYKDTNEPLLPEYAQIIKETEINHSPIQTIQRYVGNFKPEQLISFEQLYQIINSRNFQYYTEAEDILYTAAQMFKSNSKLVFPEELNKYI